MELTVTETISAPTDAVYARLIDVDSWQQWSIGVLSSETDGPFAPGMRARVVQHGVRATVWTVQRATPGEGFRWTSSGLGFVMAMDYRLEPTDRGTAAQVEFTAHGPMAWPVWLIAARPTRQLLRDQMRMLGRTLTGQGPGPRQ